MLDKRYPEGAGFVKMPDSHSAGSRTAGQRGRRDAGVLYVRMRPEDRRVLERRARDARMSLSAWVRFKLLADAGAGHRRA